MSYGATLRTNGIQSSTVVTAEAEWSRNFDADDAEQANVASGAKQASFESYAIFQSERQKDAVTKIGPPDGDEGIMGASVGPWGPMPPLAKKVLD